MLKLKRKRVSNPNLMVKAILLSVFVGAFTMVASFPVHASLAEKLDEIFENDPPNEEQINLEDKISENDPPNEEQISPEEELAILTGRDNHSEYLPNYSVGDYTGSEEEEDYYDPSERSMMSEYISQVDIPPTEEFTRAKKICKAYDDAMLKAENCKGTIDLASIPSHPKTAKEYRSLISRISFFASPSSEIINYMGTGHSEDEQNVFSATLRSEVQDHMFAQFKKAKREAWDLGYGIYKAPIALQEIPSDDDIPRFEVELFENERNEQSNKHQNKHGDLCPGLFSKCNLI